VIAVRAGAARLRHDEDPDRTRAALQEIEDLARRTAGEIDHIVGTLRDRGHGGVEAPPGLASLGTLVDQHTRAGLDVSVEVSGPEQRVGDAADQAAYRILQEALTNAGRHGAGSALVTVAFTGIGLELTVTNPVAPTGTAQPGGGHGLVGMRERATLLGGDLDAGCRDGTFRVEARIPGGDAAP
jgi:signal transduction histidine kinase